MRMLQKKLKNRQKLQQKPQLKQQKNMKKIGYKEAALALRGEISRDEAIELIKRESRRYAKRQLTWLRRSDKVNWIYWDEKPDLDYARRLSTAFFDAKN